jgi:hypothetical protein
MGAVERMTIARGKAGWLVSVAGSPGYIDGPHSGFTTIDEALSYIRQEMAPDAVKVEPADENGLPSNFIVDAARGALTDIDDLSSAFVWIKTPQGFDFWKQQVDRKRLSREGRTILERWIAIAENVDRAAYRIAEAQP